MIRKNIVSFIAILIGTSALLLHFTKSEKKVAYVNTLSLFNEFSLKKNMELELNQLKSKHQFTLDSLRLELQNIEMEFRQSGKKEIATSDPALIKYKTMENDFRRLSKLFEEQEIQRSSEMDQLIWAQLNQYCIDYAEKNNIDILLGANGNGSIMYGDKAMDLTPQLIIYVNEAYEGRI